MQTLTVCGGNLFNVACRVLGDAARWSDLAALNGIDDPWLNGIITLVIPASSKVGSLGGQ